MLVGLTGDHGTACADWIVLDKVDLWDFLKPALYVFLIIQPVFNAVFGNE